MAGAEAPELGGWQTWDGGGGIIARPQIRRLLPSSAGRRPTLATVQQCTGAWTHSSANLNAIWRRGGQGTANEGFTYGAILGS